MIIITLFHSAAVYKSELVTNLSRSERSSSQCRPGPDNDSSSPGFHLRSVSGSPAVCDGHCDDAYNINNNVQHARP